MIYRFDCFEVDDEAFRLTEGGEPISLEPKTLRLLLYLVQNRGRLNRKQELLDAIWQDATVTENALTRSVGLLRKSLKDSSREPRFIETVPTAGYRFIAQVEVATSQPTTNVAPLTAAGPGSPQKIVASRLQILRLATIVLACLLVLAAIFWVFAAHLHSKAPIRSLAVLPLNNLSGDPTQDYFADGMTDELITEFAHIPGLRVASRTSVMLDKSQHKSLPEIARQLNVDAIVEGSTVRSGDRVRITAQLIDARTDRHLWAQSFEGPASDVLTLQDNVASQIATQARLVLLPPPRQHINPAAYDAYLRGRYFFNKEDLPHSVEYFQQAISIDPSYASAYAGYSSAYEALSAFGLMSPDEVMPKALDAARRAIQLDPNNAEAFTELGSIQTIYTWDWSAAEQNLTHGISLDPSNPMAEFKYATYLDAVGRPEDAVTHMRRAVELDPLSFIMNRRLGATLYLAHEYDAALAQLQRAAEMENSPASIDNYLSLIYEQKGERDLAVQNDLNALQAGLPRLDVNALLTVYGQQGWQSYWRARTRTLLTVTPVSCTPYEIGVDDLRVGDSDQAFDSFQHAIDQHCFNMALIRVDPLFDPIRHDPRYIALLRHIHQ